LAVDDLVPCHIAGRWWLRLVNYRTQEVIGNWGLAPVKKIALGDADHVVPQRGPLALLVPDIGALKCGNLKVATTLEKISRASRMSIHCMHLSTTTSSVTRYRSTKHESDKSCIAVIWVAGFD
jgi:hypothetical protein